MNNDNVLNFIKNYWEGKKLQVRSNTAGTSIDAWDTTYLPPEEWATSIFEDAQARATILSAGVRRYDSLRKVTVPMQLIQTADWSSTVSQDITGATTKGSTKYGAKGKALDPVEYRTFMPIARKSLDEATWSVEADVRNRLTNVTALEIDTLFWASLDGTALAATKYQTAGESLTNTTTANAVDYGAGANIDHLIEAIYNVRATSKNFFIPNTAQVSPGIMKDLMKDYVSGADDMTKRSAFTLGQIRDSLNLNIIVSGNIPQDSGSTDIGLVYDNRAFFIANIPIDFEIAPELYRPTDDVRFYVKFKADMDVGDPESGAVLYT